MTYPPGTIILVSGELARYTTFMQSMLSLVAPQGSQVVWKPGVNIAGNLNLSLAERQGEWVFLMGDDHLFAPDLLWRLLRHEKDVVAPLVCKRKPPFDPLVYRQSTSNLMGIEGIPPQDLPAGGLILVAACACAGILIQRYVIDALVPPYFEVGQVRSDELQEDLYFLQKVRAKGFELYVDLDTKIGHTTPATVWPQYQDGRWQVLLDLEGHVPEMGGSMDHPWDDTFVKMHHLTDVAPGVTYGPNCRIWAFAVVRDGVRMGARCVIGSKVYIGSNTVLGDDVRVQDGSHLTDHMHVGSRVFVGALVVTMNDRHPRVNNPAYVRESPIIEDDVNIGCGAVILPGVRLGRGCTIGAGAVVTKDVPPGMTVIGNPSRLLMRHVQSGFEA